MLKKLRAHRFSAAVTNWCDCGDSPLDEGRRTTEHGTDAPYFAGPNL